jgi:serine/threonine-protein kinase
VDARSDVYSCGILLYQLICGRTPFTGDSPIEIAINQVRMPPDPPSSVVPGIHPQLEQIILTALEKWPAQRQQSAAELRDALLALLPLLADERKVVADGKQPPPPEVHADDRAQPASLRNQPSPPSAPQSAPISDDMSDLASTIRKEEGLGPAPQGKGGMPTLAPRLPAAISGPLASGPSSAPVSQPAPSSSGPFSEPASLPIFPRPIEAPAPADQPPGAPFASPVAPPGGGPIAIAPARPAARAPAIPSWLVLLVAVVVGVGVGVAAHFLAR